MNFKIDGTKLLVLTILITPLVLIGIAMLLSLLGCGGWNEGSMSGTCTISSLTELYNGLNATLLMAAFTGFLWLPLIVVFYIVGVVTLLRSAMKKEAGFLKNNWLLLTVCLIWTVMVVVEII